MKRNTLRQEYYKLGLGHWKTHNGRLNIEYVNWIEDKLTKEDKELNKLPQDWEIYQKAQELDEKEFEQWMFDSQNN